MWFYGTAPARTVVALTARSGRARTCSYRSLFGMRDRQRAGRAAGGALAPSNPDQPTVAERRGRAMREILRAQLARRESNSAGPSSVPWRACRRGLSSPHEDAAQMRRCRCGCGRRHRCRWLWRGCNEHGLVASQAAPSRDPRMRARSRQLPAASSPCSSLSPSRHCSCW